MFFRRASLWPGLDRQTIKAAVGKNHEIQFAYWWKIKVNGALLPPSHNHRPSCYTGLKATTGGLCMYTATN
jgi:hypothetical protein